MHLSFFTKLIDTGSENANPCKKLRCLIDHLNQLMDESENMRGGDILGIISKELIWHIEGMIRQSWPQSVS